MAQDLFYYESGYIDDNYFAYVADATADLSSASTLSATLANVQSADLVAFTNASLTADIVMLLSAEAQLATQSTLASEGILVKVASSALDSNFATSADAEITKLGSSNLNSSFTITESSINYKNATADASSAFEVNASAENIIQLHSELNSSFSITESSINYKSAESQLGVTSTVTSGSDNYKSADSELSSSFSITESSINYKSASSEVSITAECSAIGSLQLVGSFNSTTTSEVNASADVEHNADSQLEVTATINATGRLYKAASVFVDSWADVSATAGVIKQLASQVTGNFALTESSINYKNADSQITSTFAVNATAGKIVQIASSESSAFALSESSINYKNADSQVTGNFALSESSINYKNAESSSSSSFAVTATCGIVHNASTAFTVNSSQVSNGGFLLLSTFGYDISGVQFKPAGQTYSSWIEIADIVQSGEASPAVSYLISFWAYNASGNILSTEVNGYQDVGGNIIFDGNNLTVHGYPSDYSYPATYRYTTWTNVPVSGWHQYILRSNGTTSVDLYVDGILASYKTDYNHFDIGSGNQPANMALNTYSAYQAGYDSGNLVWMLGGDASNYGPYNDEYYPPGGLDAAISGNTRFTGAITQFAAWFGETVDDTNVPQPSNESVRQKLYDDGLVDLGTDGTATGLNQPKIYLRLSDTTDITQRGSLSLTNYRSGEPAWCRYNEQTYTYSQQTWRKYDVITPDSSYGFTESSGAHPIIGNFTLHATAELAYKQGEAHLNSSFTQTASAVKVNYAESNLTVDSSINATWINSYFASSNLIVDTTLTSGSDNYKFASSEQTANFTQTAVPHVTRDASSELTAIASVISAGNSMPPVLAFADLASEFTQSSNCGLIQQIESATQAETQLTASPDVEHNASLDIAGEFTVDATGRIYKEASFYADGFAQLNVTAIETLGGEAYLESTFTSSGSGVTRAPILGSADLHSVATVDATGGINLVLAIPMQTYFDLNATGESLAATFGNASLNSNFTINASATSTPALQASSNLTSEFAVEPTGYVTRFAFADVTSNFTVDATGRISNVRGTSNLQSAFAVTGRGALKPRIDPHLTVIVPSETRGYFVLPENRIGAVCSENRNGNVLKETRLSTVESESRINTLS